MGGTVLFSKGNSCCQQAVSSSSHGQKRHTPFPPNISQLRDKNFCALDKSRNNSTPLEGEFPPDKTPALHRVTPTHSQHVAAADHQGCPWSTTAITTKKHGMAQLAGNDKKHTRVHMSESLRSHLLKTTF